MKVLSVFLILGILLLSLFSISNVSAISSSDKVVYPLYSSTCCDISNAVFRPETDAPSSITKSDTQYTCKINSECRLRNPVVSCPGKSLGNLWLGYKGVVQIKTPGGEYNVQIDANGNIVSDNTGGLSGIPFGEGQSVSYHGACFNNAQWIWTIVSFTNWLSGAGSAADYPTTSSLIIESRVATLKESPALEGTYYIPGTQYCQRNAQVNTLASNLPRDDSAGKRAADLARSGASDAPGDPIKELLDTSRFYVGECRLAVDKYLELPFAYNVNPKGQYQSQDVICSQSKGIVSVKSLSTEGGATWYGLNQVLKSSGFCCNDQDCKSLGMDYNCEQNSYTCQKIAGYCNSDLDCRPMGGQIFENNCYRNANGKFYAFNSACISNRCSPYPAAETEVKCCAGYCSLTNQVCDQSKGCYNPITPLPDCANGFCCDGTTNKFQACSSGLACCYETGATVGTCKSACVTPPECTKNEDCPSSKPVCENNKCISSGSLQCSWYQEPYTTDSQDWGFLGWRHLTNNPISNTTTGCKTSMLVYFMIGIGAVLIAIFIKIRGKGKRRK